MFKNEFQGGPFVEVFSAQGRDPVAKWRLSGSQSAFKKIFDKEVKSYVYVLEGESTTTKMSIPKDEKQSLFLIQKYLVLQVLVPLGHSFSFELVITDLGNNKRRIFLSSSHRDITVTPLHARFPLSILRLGVWLNLCLDLNSLVGETFKEQTFKSIDSLTLSANCHLRKIFTLKVQPPDTTDDDEIYGCQGETNAGNVESIPKSMQFTTTNHQTQVINLLKLRQADIKAREAAGLPPPATPPVSDVDTTISKQDGQPTHIAFGSKIVIPKHARKSSREGGPTSAGSRSSSNSFQRSSSISNVRSGSPQDLDSRANSATHRGKFQRSMSETTDVDQSKLPLGSIQPRPPRTGSGSKVRRRPLRVRTKGGTSARSAGSRTNSESDKLGDSTSSYGKPDGASTERNFCKGSDAETMSRSQSESSLKASGNDSSLGESISKLKLDDQKVVNELTEENLKKNDMMFTFSSMPRSAPRSPRNRKKRQNGFRRSPVQEKPDIEITAPKDAAPLTRDRRESEKSEYEEDFCKNDSESSDDDILQKLLKTSNNSRSSSRGSKHSPRSPRIPETSETPHVLRASIKSSLLKEIPSSVIESKTYDSKAYQSNASSWRNYQSEAGSSWRFDTSGSSSSFLDKSLNSSLGDEGPLIKRFTTSDDDDNDIVNNDGGDSLSDNDSDETCSTWKVPPPARHHTYQDEMKHPGLEPDMSATLLMDPRDYADVFSPPIVMPSARLTNGANRPQLHASLLQPNTIQRYSSKQGALVQQSMQSEMELDLLYDPCLNCYFDPKSNKYYELA